MGREEGEFGESLDCVGRLPQSQLAPLPLLVVENSQMLKVVHEKHALFDQFISFVLSQNVRIQEDPIDQLLTSARKARALLLLASYFKEDQPPSTPGVSHEIQPPGGPATLDGLPRCCTAQMRFQPHPVDQITEPHQFMAQIDDVFPF